MKAKYKPKDIDRLSSMLRDSVGKTFNFKPARPVNNVPRYWPDDLLFPGSSPVPETDLEFEEEQKEFYCHKCSETAGICNPVFHLAPVCV